MSGLFGGEGQSAKDTTGPLISTLRIQTSAYGRAIPVLFGTTRISGNLIDYDDFTAIPHTSSQPSGGGGKGGDGARTPTNTTFTYTAMVLLGLCHGPIGAIGTVWRDKDQNDDLSVFFTDLFTGSAVQTPWGFLTTNHPGKALSYRNLAYVAHAAMDLGDNAGLGNFSFEVTRLPVDYGRPDAAVKDVISEIVTNTLYGLGLPGAMLGDFTAMHNYCGANNIWVSPAYVDREPAAGVLLRLTNIANAGPFWSEDVLKIVPYGDTAITANGFVFNPDLTPQYDLDDKDYLDKDQPVRLVRKTPADLFNQATGNFFNRASEYNEQPVEYKDQADIELNGLKSDPNERTYHEIALQESAQAVIDAEGRRGLYGIGNVYETRITAQYDLLEPMDLITLTDPALDLNRQLVRINRIEEDGDEGLNLEVEEVTVGTASPALYSSQVPGGYAANFNVAPGSVSTPVIFDLPGIITDTGFEVGIAASGLDPNWGGANVWIATDSGGPYKLAGRISGAARHGVLSLFFDAGVDPDVLHTCSVDLTVSKGELTGGTQVDADNRSTLSWIEGELISFQTAALTATYKYDLNTYVRRGVFNTVIAAHDVGSRFVRLDQAVFRYAYAADFIGKTLYVKLASFNIYGGGQQSLDEAVAYTYTLPGPIGAPDVVKNFAVSQNGSVAVFQWDLLGASNISGYEIRYNPAAAADPTNWNNATPLTQVTKGTQITTAKLPPGSWMCLIKAVDDSQKYSLRPTSYAIVMTNQNTVVASVEQAPGWFGEIPGNSFIRHPSGVLIPDSTKLASQMTKAEIFTEFVPYPVASCTYTAPEIDLAFDSLVRIHEDITSNLGHDVHVGVANPVALLDYRTVGGAYHGFQPWTIGNVLCRFMKGQVMLTPANGDAIVTNFAPTADVPNDVTPMNGVVIAPGGTVVAFPAQRHFPPNVQATMAAGAASLTPVVTLITTTTCLVNVYNPANVSVGGTVNLTLTGP